jgi:hypothetical protein
MKGNKYSLRWNNIHWEETNIHLKLRVTYIHGIETKIIEENKYSHKMNKLVKIKGILIDKINSYI